MTAAKSDMIFPRRWAFFAVGILFTHFAGMMFAVTIFVRNHNGDVIPDYYEKAVHWDEQKAALAKNNAVQPPVLQSEAR
jgi:hypothetical protein